MIVLVSETVVNFDSNNKTSNKLRLQIVEPFSKYAEKVYLSRYFISKLIENNFAFELKVILNQRLDFAVIK